MAQVGTDVIETVTAAGAAFVAPVDLKLVGFAPSLTTASSSGARTLTVSVNGSAVGQTASCPATQTYGAAVALTTAVAVSAGDRVTVAGSGGTGAAGDTVALWLQRAA